MRFVCPLICFSWISSCAFAASTPEEALSTFQIHPDFELELVAHEPAVIDPVDLKFDEQGRVFVLEFGGYPTAPENEADYPGNIVLLKDRDGDGKWETRQIFADKFRYADSILPYHGGLLVASPPHLLFVKDTNGDEVADVREPILSGFDVGNTQHNFNGLTHGLDNWIYGATGGNSGSLYLPDRPDKKMPLRWRDFRFDPAHKQLEFIGESSGGFGVAFDDYGRFFGTHNLYPFLTLVIRGHYLTRNPYISFDGTLDHVPDYREGDLTRIYPIGVQETRVNHPEQSGYFSGSCGVTHYGGSVFGSGFDGSLFVCDVVLNLVHRGVLRNEGTTFRTSRADEKREFLASTDRWFRPVNMTVGPDGALYVLDFHRAVIEHPEWIPDEIEKDMDIDAGKDKGRIYRITPKGGLPHPKPDFKRENLEGALHALGSINQWWRDTAKRMLIEWDAQEAVPMIEDLYNKSDDPRVRVHALWTLRGLGALDDEFMIKGLRDDSPGVNENALILAEDGLEQSPDRIDAVIALADRRDARVRMQVALTLGEIAATKDEALARRVDAALRKIAEQDHEDRWTRTAILTAIGPRPLPLFTALSPGEGAEMTEGRSAMLRSLAHVIGARKQNGEIEAAVANLGGGTGGAAYIAATLDGLAEGLEREPDPARRLPSETKAKFEESIAPLFDHDSPDVVRSSWRLAKALNLDASESQKKKLAEAKAIASDSKRSTDERLANLQLLEFMPYDEKEDALFALLNVRNPKPIQLAAIDQLSKTQEQRVAERLLKTWNELAPDVRRPASNILIYRRPNHDLLITALENGDLLIGQLDLDLERRRALLRSRDENIRKRAEALFSDAGVVTRAEAMDKMRPALKLHGDAARGKKVFENNCIKCHKIAGEGAEVGPDLTEIYRKSGETLLHDILDPNAAFDPKYISVTIVTDDGQIRNGLVHAEDDAQITLREAEGKDTVIPRAQIKEMRASGLSLMPEELETGMDHQAMADLLAFLQQPK